MNLQYTPTPAVTEELPDYYEFDGNRALNSSSLAADFGTSGINYSADNENFAIENAILGVAPTTAVTDEQKEIMGVYFRKGITFSASKSSLTNEMKTANEIIVAALGPVFKTAGEMNALYDGTHGFIKKLIISCHAAEWQADHHSLSTKEATKTNEETARLKKMNLVVSRFFDSLKVVLFGRKCNVPLRKSSKRKADDAEEEEEEEEEDGDVEGQSSETVISADHIELFRSMKRQHIRLYLKLVSCIRSKVDEDSFNTIKITVPAIVAAVE